MYSVNRSRAMNGSSHARRWSTASLPWATAMNRAMADSRASASLVTRSAKPSAISWAWSQSPSL